MLNANFSVTSNTGYVYATDFTFTDLTTSTSNIVHRTWDLGDDTFLYDVTTVTKTYNYPGTYNISLTATNLIGEISTYSTQVTTDYFLRDAVIFERVPSQYANPGDTTESTFYVKVSSAQVNRPLVVNLFATNSPSTPYQFVPEHWRFLTPTWRFTDKNLNFITSLSVESQSIYLNDKVVGLTGEAEFYYIDDKSTGRPTINCPVLITAALETSGFNYPLDSNVYSYPSYANNENTIAATTWLVNDIRPNVLKVTENYLSDIFPQKWKDVKVPFIVTCHKRLNGVDSNIIFSYPESNAYGSISSVAVSLSNTNGVIVDEAPLYFKATDKNNSGTGGFIFTTLTPTSAIATTVIQASTVAFYQPGPTTSFAYPAGEIVNPIVWLSNSSNSALNKIFLPIYPNNCESINFYKNKNLLYNGYTKTVNNILNYSLAIDPNTNEVYTADTYKNILYKLSSNGSILSSLALSTINTSFSSASAANIALDENLNVFLTFFNSTSVLKFNKNFSLLTSFTYPSAYSYKPPVVETDRQSNVWLAFSSALSTGTLQKYSSANSQLLNIALSLSSVPVSLAITLENNVWVANSFNQILTGGIIQLYNTTTGTLMSSISGYTHPTSLYMDSNNGVWFTHNTRNLGYISNTGATYSWLVSSVNTTPSFSAVAVPSSTQKLSAVYAEKELGGLAIDSYDRIWIIDSLKSNVYALSASTTISNSAIRLINLGSSAGSIASENFKPFQSYGDWTGNEWYQKYYRPQSVSAISLQGTSTPFQVREFTNPAQIYRVNENFDSANYYKSLALPEILNQNSRFFDTFLGAVVGNSVLSSYEDLGQKTYERIANFVYNTADIDTCNIDQLLSFAQETTTPFLNYGLFLPSEIKKYLDISSVPKLKLWGIQSPVPLSSQSIGTQLNTTTALVTAGTKIYLKSKFNNQYILHTVPLLSAGSIVPLSAQSVYPLSSMNEASLIPPILNNYFFFEYTPAYSSTFIENLIDWSNTDTTLNPCLSTVADWYGESGAIENAFNYLLTKNIIVK